MNWKWSRVAAGLAVTLGALLGLPTAQAMSMDGVMNLSTLTVNSPVIVVGTVSDVTTGMTDGNLAFVEIQVTVGRVLKGSVDGTLSLRQLNLPAAQPAQNGRRYIGLVPGMPTYTKGEQVLLFVGNEGEQGLRTTMGLGLGKFVLRGSTVQNEVQNQGLFRDVRIPAGVVLNEKEQSMFATTQGGVSTDTFVNLIQRAVLEGWWGGPTTSPSRPTPKVPSISNPTSPLEAGIGGLSHE